MIKKFLTIPIAPNYEINSRLMVRNKTTGHILKTKKKGTVILCVNGKRIEKTVKSLRSMAKLAARRKFFNSWSPVPSLKNLYELNKYGFLRNARTKRILDIHNSSYHVFIDEAQKSVSRNELLWEVFGIIKPSKKAIPVTLINGSVVKKFPNRKQAASFLAANLHYSEFFMRKLLYNRRSEIHGWQIKYLEILK